MDEKPRVSYDGQSGLSQLATDAKSFLNQEMFRLHARNKLEINTVYKPNQIRSSNAMQSKMEI